MKYELVKKENSEITVKAEITPEEFAEALKFSYNKNKNKYSVPGFRKGKAPESVIERAYGEGVFYEDAANKLIYEKYPEVLDGLKLEPTSKPEIDIEEIGHKEGLVFTAVFAVMPEFELGEYKGLKYEKVKEEVDEVLVESRINDEREKNGRMSSVDRPAKDGDIVNLDFVGKIDGEAFDGGTGEGHDLTLGSGSFIPGFEEQLVGAKAGSDVEVKVTFPEDYQEESLAGKEAIFECTINSIQEKELPELDDEFAKDVSEFDTLEEYKNSIREELKKDILNRKDEMKRERVLDAAEELMTADIPEKMIETEIDDMMENFANSLKRQGLSPDQYFQFVGGEEKVREDIRESAIKRIKQNIVVKMVKDKENLEVTDEDVLTEMHKDPNGKELTIERIVEIMGEQGLDQIRENLKAEKTIQFLIDNAVEQ